MPDHRHCSLLFVFLPISPAAFRYLNQSSKERNILVVHDLLMVSYEMANTQPGTAVFTTYSWAQRQGLLANHALNMHSPSQQLCRIFQRALDTVLGVRCWTTDTVDWLNLKVENTLVLLRSETTLGLETPLPRGWDPPHVRQEFLPTQRVLLLTNQTNMSSASRSPECSNLRTLGPTWSSRTQRSSMQSCSTGCIRIGCSARCIVLSTEDASARLGSRRMWWLSARRRWCWLM